MPPKIRERLAALTLLALPLLACSTRGDAPMSANLSDDDDSYCRANAGPVGSPSYVACRKDRDTQRGNAVSRADSKQRDLAEWMLNHP